MEVKAISKPSACVLCYVCVWYVTVTINFIPTAPIVSTVIPIAPPAAVIKLINVPVRVSDQAVPLVQVTDVFFGQEAVVAAQAADGEDFVAEGAAGGRAVTFLGALNFPADVKADHISGLVVSEPISIQLIAFLICVQIKQSI